MDYVIIFYFYVYSGVVNGWIFPGGRKGVPSWKSGGLDGGGPGGGGPMLISNSSSSSSSSSSSPKTDGGGPDGGGPSGGGPMLISVPCVDVLLLLEIVGIIVRSFIILVVSGVLIAFSEFSLIVSSGGGGPMLGCSAPRVDLLLFLNMMELLLRLLL